MKKNILFFLPMLVVLAGCGDEAQLRPVEGKVSLTVSSVTTKAEAVVSTIDTRSATLLPSGSSIGVFRLSSPDYAPQSNVEYSYVTSWSAATPIYLTEKTASVCAYYPYSATIGDNPITTGTVEVNNPALIPLTAQIYSNAADLCYAGATSVTSATPGVSFTMNRAYAKMTFTIARTTSYEGAGNISNISVVNSNIVSQNALNIATATYNSSPVIGSVSIPTNVTLPAAGGGSSTVEILLPPSINTITDDVTFIFTLDGETAVANLPAGTNNLSSISAGNNYTVSATISAGATFTVNSVTITDWINVSSGTAHTVSLESEANCYIVPLGQSVNIPVSRVATAWTQVNGSTYTLPTSWTAGLLWTTNSNGLSELGSIAAIDYNREGGYIKVSAGSTEGNGVIAIYDNDGTTILWSWHIWVTDQPASETMNGYEWMDRNLGATEVATNTAGITYATCGGFYYQWGRKDPFPGNNGTSIGNPPAILIYNTSGQMTNTSITYEGFTPTATGTTNDVIKRISVTTSPLSYATQCSYSIKYPLLFLSDWAGSTATAAAAYTAAGGISSWGGENGEPKSIFDPCPAGWRVPSGRTSSPTFVSPWSSWATSGSYYEESTYAAVTWAYNKNVFRYPVNGLRNAIVGKIGAVGSSGFYWSASKSQYSSGDAYGLGISRNSAEFSTFSLVNGFTVRCVQE